GRHLLADDALDLGAHAQPQRQPGEHSRRLPTDVPGAHEQLVAGGLGVGRVFLQGADEELREERGHPFTVSARAAPRTQLVTTTGSPTGASAPISSAMRCASAMRVATISDSGTVLMTSPFTKIWPLPLPEATPRSASRASPGPFTTHPMTATRSGTVMPCSPSVTESASVYTSTWARPHDEQDTISSLRSRRLSDCRICRPTLTSSAGGAESETRIVSPMPSESRMPKAVADLIVPWNAGPASVTPRCSGQSPRSASIRYAFTMTTGSLCLTEILKSWKSCSSKRLASHTALSTSASAVGRPYFSSRRRSSEPALTPIRSDTPAARAAAAISPTLSSNWRMLPGFTRTAAQPASIAWKTYFGWKWMSAMTGIWLFWAMMCSTSASSWLGTATRTMSQPDAVSSAICWRVALMFVVGVVVIDCTLTGAPPPTRTFPTLIWRVGRRGASTSGGGFGIPMFTAGTLPA